MSSQSNYQIGVISSIALAQNPKHHQNFSDENGRPYKKPRASKPKVKSGCLTCKIRRVKCDERKPSCARCEKFGRRCDGYVAAPSHGRALIQLQPRILTGDMYGLSVSAHNTEAESRYFGIFVDRVAYELSGFFEPTFWTRLVLQESHNVPAIRHAVIAMGALNKSLETAPAPKLKVNVIQSIDRKHHEQAVLSYIKAIQALNTYISASQSPQLRTTLIACLLFVCFETFQGSFASSVQQMYGGLKILRNYYAGKPGSRPSILGQPALAAPKATGRGKLSKALLNRGGCSDLSNEVTTVMHVEEYSSSENETQPDYKTVERGRWPNLKQQNTSVQFLEYDPVAKHVAIPCMRNSDVAQEQQRTLGIYTAIQQKQIPPNKTDSPRTSESSLRKNSSLGSRSTPGTPRTPTNPSTGPHTPSLAQQENSASGLVAASGSQKRPLATRSPSPHDGSALKNDLTIEEVLIQSFVRLDGQGLFFGMAPGIPPLIWDIHQVFQIPIPASFSSFASAQRCWDFLMDRALQFYRRTAFNRTYAPMSADPPDEIAKQHAIHIRAITSFSTAVQQFTDAAISPRGEILNPAALVLSLYPKLVAIMLCTLTNESEMLYDSFLEDFRYIVKICTLLIVAGDTIRLPRNKRFSLDIGVIPPLHVTATKCRDPKVRREAIELLFKSARQEGMWDGVLSARIGRWIMACEEDGLTLPKVQRNENSIARHEQYTRVSSGYPSPPHRTGESCHSGGWEDGMRIRDTVKTAVGHGADYTDKGNGALSSGSSAVPWRPSVRAVEDDAAAASRTHQWVVPESSRFKLMVVDFHIPERYIKVKCQKVMLSIDGTREERETVIAW